ncbi:MAG: YbaB/EbfC family nucleoid-associated protein [Planctomycetota bacterium]
MFKGLGNLGNLLKQAQEMGGRVQEINAALQAERVTGIAGGGMVEVEMNGLGETLNVRIDPTLIDKNEAEMIEDLLRAAFNQGREKAQALHGEKMKSLADGVNLPFPGMQDALAKMMNPSHDPEE